ncbi:MAG TPA: hypothetical protein VGB98_09915 [Pyrinomonadaceae bacterium]|jgi:hypothetical protein
MTDISYNDEMDAGGQADAEEHIAATIFERRERLGEGARLSRGACDRLGFEILCEVLRRFPTEYEVSGASFKHFRAQMAGTIFDRQRRERGGRVLGEDDCNQLGRELLARVISYFRPDLTEAGAETAETVEA